MFTTVKIEAGWYSLVNEGGNTIGRIKRIGRKWDLQLWGVDETQEFPTLKAAVAEAERIAAELRANHYGPQEEAAKEAATAQPVAANRVNVGDRVAFGRKVFTITAAERESGVILFQVDGNDTRWFSRMPSETVRVVPKSEPGTDGEQGSPVQSEGDETDDALTVTEALAKDARWINQEGTTPDTGVYAYPTSDGYWWWTHKASGTTGKARSFAEVRAEARKILAGLPLSAPTSDDLDFADKAKETVAEKASSFAAANLSTIDLHPYKAIVDVITGTGVLVSPPAPEDIRLSEGGASLHDSLLGDALRQLLRHGVDALEGDDGALMVEGVTADGRTVYSLYVLDPVKAEPSLEEIDVSIRALRHSAGLAL